MQTCVSTQIVRFDTGSSNEKIYLGIGNKGAGRAGKTK